MNKEILIIKLVLIFNLFFNYKIIDFRYKLNNWNWFYYLELRSFFLHPWSLSTFNASWHDTNAHSTCQDCSEPSIHASVDSWISYLGLLRILARRNKFPPPNLRRLSLIHVPIHDYGWWFSNTWKHITGLIFESLFKKSLLKFIYRKIEILKWE